MWHNWQQYLPVFSRKVPVYLSSELPFEQKQTRGRIIENLSRTYKNNQRNSLQGMAWIKMDRANGLDDISQVAEELLNPLFPKSSILQNLTGPKHGPLLLGKAGAGKSSLLLALAQELLEYAEQDEQYPLPVIVPLSSWATKDRSFQDWLNEQISQIYDIPYRLSKRWVEEQRFLPLFDGLDEVNEAEREHCITALNAYHLACPGMLVACNYSIETSTPAYTRRLTLQHEAVVQPFPQEQVNTLLAHAGAHLEALRQAIAGNPTLQELTTTPLMLTICMLAYHRIAISSLPEEETLLQKQIWQDYIQRMIARNQRLTRHSYGQIQQWLNWLAQQMQTRDKTIFFLESLQPDWLPGKQRSFYHWSCRLVFGLLGALIAGLLFGIEGALVGGLLGAVLETFNRKIRLAQTFVWSWKRTRSALPGSLLIGLTLGLLGVLIYALIAGLSAGPVLGPLYAIVVALPESLPIGILAGISGGIFGSIIYGFLREHIPEYPTFYPYLKIRRSAINGTAGAILGGLAGGLACKLFALLMGKTALVLPGILAGILAGAIIFGLGSVIQHFLLRIWLWQSKRFPWQVGHFLNEAINALLLQAAGRGYSFIHRLLYDYFAALQQPEAARRTISSQCAHRSEAPLATESPSLSQ